MCDFPHKQVMKVRAPWVKFVLYADSDTIIIPGKETQRSSLLLALELGVRFSGVDTVTIGRTTELYNQNLTPSDHDREGIWKRVKEVMPNMER